MRQIAQIEPLSGEIIHQRFRTRVGQHAPHLLFEHRGLLQFSLIGRVQQFIVGDAAPQEEGKPRGQFKVAEAVRRAGRNAGRVLLYAKRNRGLTSTARRPISMPLSKSDTLRASR